VNVKVFRKGERGRPIFRKARLAALPREPFSIHKGLSEMAFGELADRLKQSLQEPMKLIVLSI